MKPALSSVIDSISIQSLWSVDLGLIQSRCVTHWIWRSGGKNTRTNSPLSYGKQISRRFLASSRRELTAEEKEAFLALVHDRMTEMEYLE